MVETKVIIPNLRCQGLRHSYDNIPVLTGIDLTLQPGESLAILGRSGCGKSTLLKCLCFLEEPIAGDAELAGQFYMKEGKPLFAPWQIRSQISMVFQDYNLFPNLTVLRNMTLAVEKIQKVSPKEAIDRAKVLAIDLGIEQTLNRYPGTLSGGQAQRLALARAMILHPTVLLLDEITSALDPESIASTVSAVQQVRDLKGNEGLSIIFVTHLLGFAIGFSDYIAFLHEGQFVEMLPSRDFIKESTHDVARKFIDKSLSVLNYKTEC